MIIRTDLSNAHSHDHQALWTGHSPPACPRLKRRLSVWVASEITEDFLLEFWLRLVRQHGSSGHLAVSCGLLMALIPGKTETETPTWVIPVWHICSDLYEWPSPAHPPPPALLISSTFALDSSQSNLSFIIIIAIQDWLKHHLSCSAATNTTSTPPPQPPLSSSSLSLIKVFTRFKHLTRGVKGTIRPEASSTQLTRVNESEEEKTRSFQVFGKKDK